MKRKNTNRHTQNIKNGVLEVSGRPKGHKQSNTQLLLLKILYRTVRFDCRRRLTFIECAYMYRVGTHFDWCMQRWIRGVSMSWLRLTSREAGGEQDNFFEYKNDKLILYLISWSRCRLMHDVAWIMKSQLPNNRVTQSSCHHHHAHKTDWRWQHSSPFSFKMI